MFFSFSSNIINFLGGYGIFAFLKFERNRFSAVLPIFFYDIGNSTFTLNNTDASMNDRNNKNQRQK